MKTTVRIRGTIVAIQKSPIDDQPQWRHVFDLTLPGGIVVQIEVAAETRLLHSAAAGESAAHFEVGQRAELIGEAADRFDDDVGGIRQAAAVEHVIQASVLAVGPNAGRLLDRAVGKETKSLAAVYKEHRPPDGLRLWWEAKGTRLVIEHQQRSLGEELSKVGFGIVAAIGVGYLLLFQLSLWTKSIDAAGRVLDVLLYLLPAIPPALYLLLVNRVGGVRIFVDTERICAKPAPLPWFGGRAVSSAEVREVLADSGTLRLRLDDERRWDLISVGNGEQIDYVCKLIDKMLLEGPGPWIERAAKPRPTLKRRVLKVAALCATALPLAFVAAVVFLPTCSLTCGRDDLGVALARAERCTLITDRLGKNLTWAVGCNNERPGEGMASLKIKGDRTRGELFMMVKDGRFRFATVTAGGDEIDVFGCRLRSKKRTPR